MEGGAPCTGADPDTAFGYRVPAKPLRFELWGARGDHTSRLPTSRRLARIKLHEEQHKGHEVYTSSGHHCGVIPYSSMCVVDCLRG